MPKHLEFIKKIGGIVVEHVPHFPKIQGLSPAATAGMSREKREKIIKNKKDHKMFSVDPLGYVS